MLQSGLSVLRAIFLFVIIFSTNTIGVLEALKCHQCSGIQCLRTSFAATVECSDTLDACVSIFEGQTLVEQGCLEEVNDALRAECHGVRHQNCQICDENLCNHMGPMNYECLQCDSNEDKRCRDSPDVLQPINCPLSHTINSFCFESVQGTRVTRGCSSQLSEQLTCLQDKNCMLCSPFEIRACNQMKLLEDNSTTTTTTTTTKLTPTPTPHTPSIPTITPRPDGNTTGDPTPSPIPPTQPTEKPGGSAGTLKTNAAQIVIAVLAIFLATITFEISS